MYTPWLIHVNVWQKPPQYCKIISFQLKLKENKSLFLPYTENELEEGTWNFIKIIIIALVTLLTLNAFGCSIAATGNANKEEKEPIFGETIGLEEVNKMFIFLDSHVVILCFPGFALSLLIL